MHGAEAGVLPYGVAGDEPYQEVAFLAVVDAFLEVVVVVIVEGQDSRLEVIYVYATCEMKAELPVAAHLADAEFERYLVVEEQAGVGDGW